MGSRHWPGRTHRNERPTQQTFKHCDPPSHREALHIFDGRLHPLHAQSRSKKPRRSFDLPFQGYMPKLVALTPASGDLRGRVGGPAYCGADVGPHC